MRRTIVLPVLTALALGLSGCSTATDPAPSTAADPSPSSAAAPAAAALPTDVRDQLAGYDITATDAKAIVTALDQVPQQRPLEVQASVRSESVIFSGADGEVELPIAGDEVYVSIAPYATTTHDCFYHALGGCQGELTEEDVHVTITADDGTVLVDEDATTYANGFVGFWLPKDKTGTVEISDGRRSGEVAFDTGEDGATCITTLQLR